MIRLTALIVQDLLRDVDYGTSERSMSCTADNTRFDPDDAVLDFVTRCAGSGNSWEQRIQLIDYHYLVPEEERENIDSWENLKSGFPDITGSDVKCYCECPDFLYRFKYMIDQLDTGLEVETRPPDKRNPNLEGTVCKHLIAVFRKYF